MTDTWEYPTSGNSSYWNTSTEEPVLNAADAAFSKDVRILILYVQVIFGTVGGILVFSWLWYNRRRKSRVNALILHVAMADFFVIIGACLPQLVWEYMERQWSLGEILCKLLKFMQSFSMTASNYMVVILSIDRHQAIRSPLREPFAVWKMTLIGWVLSALISSPQLIVFRVNFINNPLSPFYNMTLCESIWRSRPRSERQAYITFVDLVVFFLPFLVLLVCYVRIFLKIAEKANEGKSNKKQTIKPGKVHLQSTPSSSLPKAKIKTLKMTIVMVMAFIICGMPYPILELIYSYGDHTSVPGTVAGILGGMAVANSAANPYVFLLFNANIKCLQGILTSLFPCCTRERRRGYYDSTASSRSEYTINRSEYTTTSKYSTATDVVELTVKNNTAANRKPGGNYSLMTTAEEKKVNSVKV